MVKFLKVIDDLIIILGKSLVKKRSGEDRREETTKPREKIGW